VPEKVTMYNSIRKPILGSWGKSRPYAVKLHKMPWHPGVRGSDPDPAGVANTLHNYYSAVWTYVSVTHQVKNLPTPLTASLGADSEI